MAICDDERKKLKDLLAMAGDEDEGATLLIPDLQRPYIWKPLQVTILIDSLLNPPRRFPLARLGRRWYGAKVESPKKVRVVGRRAVPAVARADGLQAADKLQHLLRQFPGGRDLAPVGVYRFRSHEEANEWQMKMLTRPKRGSRT